MLYAGARGTTAEEMETALHFASLQEHVHEAFNRLDLTLASRQSNEVVLRVANQVRGEIGLSPLPSFLDTLTQYYDAPFAELDFRDNEAARDTINEWVAEATSHRIPEENSLIACQRPLHWCSPTRYIWTPSGKCNLIER